MDPNKYILAPVSFGGIDVLGTCFGTITVIWALHPNFYVALHLRWALVTPTCLPLNI